MMGSSSFPTRNIQESHTLIDNIFLDNIFSTTTHSITNCMSDHDAQLVSISNLALPCIKHLPQYRRIIDEHSICKFTELLSHERWDAIFQNDNINTISNIFSDTYIKIFQTCFPLKRKLIPSDCKPWLMQGIRTSCSNKKKLYNTNRFNNDPGFKQYYKKYCKTSMLIITASKRKYYDTLISKSSNKTKTTWKIIKTITNKILAININDQLLIIQIS